MKRGNTPRLKVIETPHHSKNASIFNLFFERHFYTRFPFSKRHFILISLENIVVYSHLIVLPIRDMHDIRGNIRAIFLPE